MVGFVTLVPAFCRSFTRFSHTVAGILAHSSMQISSRAVMFWGCCWATRTFNSLQRFSMGCHSGPSCEGLQRKWPALFEPTQIKEEFRRITTVALESTFIQNLDEYTPNLLDLFKSKGGAVKADMQNILEVLYGVFAGIKCKYLYNIILQCDTIQERRDSVICITEYKVKVFIFVLLFISK
ncbi:unnamed protein product [Oncorhynchus mykiss]|uniref:Uncharacterized protein n=1 Tax=Oncorhynchus mykiss TaxID=8022 RepID=A0A060WSQ4_ONCMY|nr:unnamed protein product [Oncorhynchus mykiss]